MAGTLALLTKKLGNVRFMAALARAPHETWRKKYLSPHPKAAAAAAEGPIAVAAALLRRCEHE